MLRRALTLLVTATFAALAATVAGGCELIVPDTVPSFGCTGASASACPPTQICAPSLGKCVERSSACTVVGNCPAGQTCDPGTQRCTPGGLDGSSGEDAAGDATMGSDAPQPPFDAGDQDVVDGAKCTGIGCPCTRSADCDSNVCGGSDILTSVAGATKICTKPCCQSEDCPNDFVCFAPGTGGNYCVPKGMIARDRVLGTTKGGATCATDTDCRSGRCGANGKCLDACCTDGNCANSTHCAVTVNVEGHDVLQCGGTGQYNYLTDCSSNSQCKSAFCGNLGGFNDQCSTPCCSSTACTGSGMACFDVNVNGTAQPPGNDWDPLCYPYPQGESGSFAGKLGDNCSVNADCKSDRCIGGHCSDVCCTDADCTSVAGWHCLPTIIQGTAAPFLRCGPLQ